MKKKLMIFVLVFVSLFVFGSAKAEEFTCEIDGYKVNYDNTGKIISVKNKDGKLIEKYLSSYFKPKSKNECPSNNEAKTAIIDGGRTFYVAKEDENLGTSSSEKNADKCYYWSDDAKIGYGFNIKNSKAKRGLLYGKYDNQEDVQNWYGAYGSTSFVGKTYYDNNEGKCPQNLIFVKTKSEILVFVSDSSSVESIKTEIKSNYKNFEDNSPLVLSLISNSVVKTDQGSCMGYSNAISCERNDFYSCIWNNTEFGSYCNTDKLLYVKCGGSYDIPYQAPKIISFLITLLKVAIPIILIFVAIISLLKAVGAANEDEIKKAQKSLVRKIVASVLAFFVITIVQFVIMKVADSGDINDISSCLSCFMNNDCDSSVYYKTNVAGTYKCTTVKDSTEIDCLGNN